MVSINKQQTENKFVMGGGVQMVLQRQNTIILIKGQDLVLRQHYV